MFLLIDHRDSFTYNLAQLFAALGVDVRVVPAPEENETVVLAPGVRGVVFSPGPGHPRQAIGSARWVRTLLGQVPLLGVCLGHQILCEALGGQVVKAHQPVHGRARALHHSGAGLFAGLHSPLQVARYHSWVVGEAGLPTDLQVTAWDDEGQIMAVRHREHVAHGLQFHPESFLTPEGQALAQAFVDAAYAARVAPRAGEAAHG